MMSSQIYLKICLSALWFFAFSASANGIRKYSLDEKVRKSEIVVIGEVIESNISTNFEGWGRKFSRVTVLKVLKGVPDELISVEYQGPISELNPAPFKEGVRYLFFLEKVRGYIYVPVNGSNGVIELPN